MATVVRVGACVYFARARSQTWTVCVVSHIRSSFQHFRTFSGQTGHLQHDFHIHQISATGFIDVKFPNQVQSHTLGSRKVSSEERTEQQKFSLVHSPHTVYSYRYPTLSTDWSFVLALQLSCVFFSLPLQCLWCMSPYTLIPLYTHWPIHFARVCSLLCVYYIAHSYTLRLSAGSPSMWTYASTSNWYSAVFVRLQKKCAWHIHSRHWYGIIFQDFVVFRFIQAFSWIVTKN